MLDTKQYKDICEARAKVLGEIIELEKTILKDYTIEVSQSSSQSGGSMGISVYEKDSHRHHRTLEQGRGLAMSEWKNELEEYFSVDRISMREVSFYSRQLEEGYEKIENYKKLENPTKEQLKIIETEERFIKYNKEQLKISKDKLEKGSK